MKKSSFSKKVLSKIDKLDSRGIKDIIFSLSDKDNFLQDSLNYLPFGFLIINKDYRILFGNQFALRYFDTTKIIDQILFDIIQSKKLADLLKKKFYQSEKIEALEFLFEQEELNFYSYPVTKNGLIREYILLIYEVTEWKKNYLKENLQKSVFSLQRLTSGIAHEIRNPLGALDLHLQLIQRHLRQKEIKKDYIEELTEIIQEEITRLNKTIEDFLMVSKPVQLKKKFANLNDVITKTIKIMQPVIEQNNISYSLQLDKKLPILQLDVYAIQQVMINLIKNAIEAITENQKIKKGKIAIQTEFDATKIICLIDDNGIQLPSTEQENIATPYYSTKKTGTGLGLSIVQSILERHNAKINFSEKKSKKSKITLFFYFNQKNHLIESKN